MHRSRRITAEAALRRILDTSESGTDEDAIGSDSEPEGLLQPLTDDDGSSSNEDDDTVISRVSRPTNDEMVSKNGLVHWKKTPFPQTGRARA